MSIYNSDSEIPRKLLKKMKAQNVLCREWGIHKNMTASNVMSALGFKSSELWEWLL